jgi:hypothetical protein
MSNTTYWMEDDYDVWTIWNSISMNGLCDTKGCAYYGGDEEDKEMSDALQAEIRNKLTPFWTLTELMADEETWSKMNNHFDGKNIIENLVRQCNHNKSIILELINQINK